jgi:predicted class III extradiol MEMO1 family dioxygenase
MTKKIIMKNDPFYLSQESTWKASLGVLSADRNLCVSVSNFFKTAIKYIDNKKVLHGKF